VPPAINQTAVTTSAYLKASMRGRTAARLGGTSRARDRRRARRIRWRANTGADEGDNDAPVVAPRVACQPEMLK